MSQSSISHLISLSEMEVEDTGPDPSIPLFTEYENSLHNDTEATCSSTMAAGLTDTLSGILYSILCINKFNKLSVR